MKPGFLLSSKVTKLYENGLELSILGGLVATCFVDHLPKGTNLLKDFKIGQKLSARVISVNSISNKVQVSLKEHLVGLNNLQNRDVVSKLK